MKPLLCCLSLWLGAFQVQAEALQSAPETGLMALARPVVAPAAALGQGEKQTTPPAAGTQEAPVKAVPLAGRQTKPARVNEQGESTEKSSARSARGPRSARSARGSAESRSANRGRGLGNGHGHGHQ
ncbi:hypothetical protein SAMN06265337_2243 [Hymenobacter gelipurpurascens]|uniref:Translation initiation factor IF-2 n=1 Tax=Hymenobacter gelipurpurascens TaxID=89968 RepID=A0A212TR36_9BACT|nr:hypothetical protein [Hymenobacter gelipurpurascens]SNC68294.1 hypothetical protein SAMN06265337_2243 [Hymenobacter gelipurpurascens]